jgi:hypothetical protein
MKCINQTADKPKCSWQALKAEAVCLYETLLFLYVDRVRWCLRAAATNGSVVHPPGDIWEWRALGNNIDKENWRNRRGTCATLSTTNSIWTDPGPRASVVRGERLTAWAMARPLGKVGTFIRVYNIIIIIRTTSQQMWSSHMDANYPWLASKTLRNENGVPSAVTSKRMCGQSDVGDTEQNCPPNTNLAQE